MAEGRADRLQLSKFHALDNGRFHHQQRQINAQQRQVSAKQLVHQHVNGDVQQRCRIAVDDRTEAVFGKVADCHSQHTGKGDEQQAGHTEHERVVTIQRSAHDGSHA